MNLIQELHFEYHEMMKLAIKHHTSAESKYANHDMWAAEMKFADAIVEYTKFLFIEANKLESQLNDFKNVFPQLCFNVELNFSCKFKNENNLLNYCIKYQPRNYYYVRGTGVRKFTEREIGASGETISGKIDWFLFSEKEHIAEFFTWDEFLLYLINIGIDSETIVIK